MNTPGANDDIMTSVIKEIANEDAMKDFAAHMGSLFQGGEMVELIGDVGAGKTTFVKGLARGLAISEDIQSPSFTISRVYEARDNLQLYHYDFYRLNQAGIMADELNETVHDPLVVSVVEWADVVEGVLPLERIVIRITAPTDETRLLTISGPASIMEKV